MYLQDVQYDCVVLYANHEITVVHACAAEGQWKSVDPKSKAAALDRPTQRLWEDAIEVTYDSTTYR